ncbi:MAG: thiamine biosynthesis protein ThiF, partial [Epsilonproteobacteria bacterium]|nr:thiamine biosynthesis protein ThiF [Campylobacterota bacterium]
SYTKVYPHCKKFEDFVEQDSENIKLDLIIDATDNLEVRDKIDKFAKERGIPWVYGSVEEFHGHVCFFEKSSFDAFKITNQSPKGIAAPIVMFIASLQANLVLRYLVDLPIKKDLLYYLRFDKDGDLVIDKFRMP